MQEVINHQQHQQTTQIIVDAPIKIKPVPKVVSKNNEEVVRLVTNDEEKKEVETKKITPKMKGNIAAKFGHLNIDPSKLKIGAAPPSKKREMAAKTDRKMSIDQSASMQKASIGKA